MSPGLRFSKNEAEETQEEKEKRQTTEEGTQRKEEDCIPEMKVEDWEPEMVGSAFPENYRTLLKERNRILEMVWRKGEILNVNGETYKEILNVRFSIPFLESQERVISHFDVVSSWFQNELPSLLRKFQEDKNTRRAYLFFPELEKGEPPCNLVYFFILRGGSLRLVVFIRSFDLIRKFISDVNTALYCLKRLASEFPEFVPPKEVTFFVCSAHVRIYDTLEGY